jgi:hypothetical protein
MAVFTRFAEKYSYWITFSQSYIFLTVPYMKTVHPTGFHIIALVSLLPTDISVSTAFRPALRLTQPPIHRGLSPEVKRLGREADHSLPSGAEVKEFVELYIHSFIRLTAWYLVKHRNNFTLFFFVHMNVHVRFYIVTLACKLNYVTLHLIILSNLNFKYYTSTFNYFMPVRCLLSVDRWLKSGSFEAVPSGLTAEATASTSNSN